MLDGKTTKDISLISQLFPQDLQWDQMECKWRLLHRFSSSHIFLLQRRSFITLSTQSVHAFPSKWTHDLGIACVIFSKNSHLLPPEFQKRSQQSLKLRSDLPKYQIYEQNSDFSLNSMIIFSNNLFINKNIEAIKIKTRLEMNKYNNKLLLIILNYIMYILYYTFFFWVE